MLNYQSIKIFGKEIIHSGILGSSIVPDVSMMYLRSMISSETSLKTKKRFNLALYSSSALKKSVEIFHKKNTELYKDLSFDEVLNFFNNKLNFDDRFLFNIFCERFAFEIREISVTPESLKAAARLLEGSSAWVNSDWIKENRETTKMIVWKSRLGKKIPNFAFSQMNRVNEKNFMEKKKEFFEQLKKKYEYFIGLDGKTQSSC